MPFHEVKEYRVYMMYRANANVSQNRIDLFDANDDWFAVLKFTVDDMPDPSVSANGRYYLTFPLEQYEKTIDLLRNEKPLYLWWGKDGSGSYLRTGREDVGEEELDV